MKKGIDHTGIAIVYFCHDGEGNVLLSKRNANCTDEHYRWDCGGGSVELGEPVEETIQRELKEEYCTDILEFEFLGFRDVHREHDGNKIHWIALDFKVLVDREKAGNGEPHKFEAVEWFSVQELPEPLHSQFPHFLEKYRDRL